MRRRKAGMRTACWAKPGFSEPQSPPATGRPPPPRPAGVAGRRRRGRYPDRRPVVAPPAPSEFHRPKRRYAIRLGLMVLGPRKEGLFGLHQEIRDLGGPWPGGTRKSPPSPAPWKSVKPNGRTTRTGSATRRSAWPVWKRTSSRSTRISAWPKPNGANGTRHRPFRP